MEKRKWKMKEGRGRRKRMVDMWRIGGTTMN
jgi:hypothetical protein